MNIFSLVIALILIGLVVWLTIDTIIYVFKRHKKKKQDKEVKND